ncbi:DUF2442 domain-containing protein [Adonisia turfae]|uniref:DUF2442 domain-containing protein n=1 Tax=Adonisia turfae CCMR0081 TaxID=2292702 RepID=A0A6M0RYY1_9CYAN|nr:DUF2442 domain-containing protein [Adonisia turfae]NEZ61140.1 DUF2442 domain-containing protein [Adonisia turfae CCMR0081]
MTVGIPGSDFITIEKSRLTPLELWAFTTDEPLVKSIEFDEEHRVYKAVLRDGRHVEFSLELFAELKDATGEQLHDVVAVNMGSVLQWSELDVHYYVSGLLMDMQVGKG